MLKLFLGLLGFLGIPGILLLILLFYPEKIEKWSVMLWSVVYFVFKKGEKKIITHDIQSRVNEFSRELEKELPNYEPVGIKIQWIEESEKPRTLLKEKKIIIRMRKHENQNTNFVNASMLFISNCILTKAKRYISPAQKESIDLFVVRKLFEKEKHNVVDSFLSDYYLKANAKVTDLLHKYEIIDKVGIFFPVLVQELNFLGDKVFFKPKDSNIVAEVTKFIEFLQGFAEREVGVDYDNVFQGRYCRCAIMIIAKSFKREKGDINPYVNYIKSLLPRKLENFYLIGSSNDENKSFVNKISARVEVEFKLEKHYSKEYGAEILKNGERKRVKSYLILHRSQEVIRYYDKEYQDKYIESGDVSVSMHGIGI